MLLIFLSPGEAGSLEEKHISLRKSLETEARYIFFVFTGVENFAGVAKK